MTLAPALLFAVIGGALLAEGEREAYERGARERIRALMTAVDAELKSSITPLEALATSPHFDRDDLDAFRTEAARVLKTRADWLNFHVSRPSGEVILNLLLTQDASQPAPTDPASAARAASERRSLIGDLSWGPLAKSYVFTAHAPVIRNGSVKYVLTASVDPIVIHRLAESQNVPGDWFVAILDRKKRFVARIPAAPGKPGELASASLQKALASGREGWQYGVTLEGVETYRAFTHSDYSGWSASVAIPAKVVNRGAVRALWLFALGAVVTLVIAFTLAWQFARRITRPIVALAEAAPALGRGELAAMPPRAGVAEVRELSGVLGEMTAAIHEREERQRLAEEALRRADRAKDEFLAMLGHELRNPLGTLSSAIQLLKLGEKKPEIVDNAQAIIERQVQHMTHLVDDLLDVGRVTGGKISLERAPLNLAAVAERMVNTWREAGRLTHHEVTLDLREAWIDGDESRIEQIVSNLLENGIKYTPSGGRIAVAVRAEGAESVLDVTDTGQGLTPSLMPRVFDLFVQGERGLAREQGGLGIGLTLVKRLAELHGGIAEARSDGVDRGATFTVRLPAIPAPARGVRTEPAPAAADATARRVLVIDDNEDGRESLVAVLRLLGHEVGAAANGASGLQAAASMQPDVALIDIGLPDMDGYEVARRLRAGTPAKPLRLIALTGYGRTEDRQRALAAGFDEHLAKPVAMDALEELFARWSPTRP